MRHRTDKWGRHRYTPHYEFHLSHLRDESFTLFEIGIGGYKRTEDGGASLRMWKDYFGHAQIVGLDIEDKSFVDEERIRTYQGSQVDTEVLRTIVCDAANLRVVIDDGSHLNEHVLQTFADLFPMLPDGVIYVIEDTETSYWEKYGGSLNLEAPGTTMNMVKGLLDGLNYAEHTGPGYQPSYSERHVVGVHVYHNLVFIEKGLNDEQRSRGPFTPEELAAAAVDQGAKATT
ncbi:MAG: class I SAM-dependent methyltransferase [Ornithinibacter sp.]